MIVKRILISIGVLGILFFLMNMASPVEASPQTQVYYQTPTPNVDGRIMYVIKPGDSCLSISLLTGMDVNTLTQLNNLDADCTLIEGRELLLGVVQEPSATPGPSPTPTPILPTPTPFNGNGTICVFLFDDVNGNALAEETEPPIAGGAISISDRVGKVSLSANTTTSLDPLCFDELPEGDYNISVAPPEGYNATTNMNYPIKLKAGDQSIVDFGAQISSSMVEPTPAESGKSPLLAMIGAVLVLGGIGLGVYLLFFKK